MQKDELLQKLVEVGTCEDDVERRTMLTEISDSVGKVFDEYETASSTITTLNETINKNNDDMEKLRKANLDLFLRVGDPKKTEQSVTNTSTGNEEEPKRKFEDLFK